MISPKTLLIIAVTFSLSILLFVLFVPMHQANALTREECFSTTEHEGDPECLQYIQENSGAFTDGGNGTDIATLGGLIRAIRSALNLIVPFLVAIGVFVIIWGVFKYISHSANEEKRVEARMFIVYGVIGVFMMVSIWGFINILVNTLPLRKTPVQVHSVFPTN